MCAPVVASRVVNVIEDSSVTSLVLVMKTSSLVGVLIFELRRLQIGFVYISADMLEDLVSPLIAAQHFLTQACTKRRGVLDPVLAFCIAILQLPPEQTDYRKKDGVLHVLGSVYEALMRKVLSDNTLLVV